MTKFGNVNLRVWPFDASLNLVYFDPAFFFSFGAIWWMGAERPSAASDVTACCEGQCTSGILLHIGPLSAKFRVTVVAIDLPSVL